MKIFRIVLTGEEPPFYTITNAFKSVCDEVDTLYWDDFQDKKLLNEIIQARVRAKKYDGIFMQIQSGNIISVETAKVMSENSIVFNWTGDVRSDISWFIEIAPYVVTLFTNVTDVNTIKSLGFRSEYLQCGYDDKIYFNENRKRYDNIAFCGNYYPEAQFPLTKDRVEAVRLLKTHFPENFNLYGFNWDAASLKSEGIADNKKEALLYNVTSLGLSISHFNYSRYFSDRLLREMACGCCVLSHRFKDCELEFTDGKHIVYWDDHKDLLRKIDYYIAHPEKARELGNAAAEYVKQNYQWENFALNLKKLIKSYS
jgi:glycosyltransferase involved in cell wall biosynthesis